VRLRSADLYYEVLGNTAADIHAHLMRQAVAASHPQDNHAETRAQVAWSYTMRAAGTGTCRVADLAVELTVDTIYPRWTPTPRAAPGLDRQWDAFMAATRRHEKGHFDYAVASANDVLSALQGLRAEDCDALKATVDQTANAVLDRYHALNVKYDDQTRHGVTQGTVWRLPAR
jgi:predicted secreted Zn-dependent protease